MNQRLREDGAELQGKLKVDKIEKIVNYLKEYVFRYASEDNDIEISPENGCYTSEGKNTIR